MNYKVRAKMTTVEKLCKSRAALNLREFQASKRGFSPMPVRLRLVTAKGRAAGATGASMEEAKSRQSQQQPAQPNSYVLSGLGLEVVIISPHHPGLHKVLRNELY